MKCADAGSGPAWPVVLFGDDFTGPLDRSKWNVRPTDRIVNHEQQAYVDEPSTVYVQPGAPGAEGAVLALHPRYRPGAAEIDGVRLDFVSGRIDTRDHFAFTYGTASARIRLPAGAGVWPAFWALGMGSWPDCGEIDIMECVGEPDWVSAAVHGPGYSGEEGLVNKHFFSGDGATGWHVYTARWGPDEIVFEVDGMTAYRVTRPMVGFFGEWAFDNDKFLILNVAVGGVYPFKTNGIHLPYYGVAAETVRAIEAGKVRMLVDWVRVDSPPPVTGS